MDDAAPARQRALKTCPAPLEGERTIKLLEDGSSFILDTLGEHVAKN